MDEPIPLDIAFRGLDHRPEIEDEIRKHAAKLFRMYPRIIRCRTVVEEPHHHHQKGNLYHLRIHVEIPGEDIHVDRESQQKQTHEELQVAVRDAFQAAQRKLHDYVDRRRGH